jgi:mono/diheme cytochrome c family protein
LRPLTSRRLSPRLTLRRADSFSKPFVVVLLLALVGLPGCWEQASVEWWPQMKWQPSVQAFELNPYQDRISLFAPPEGTVPVDWADVADPAMLSPGDQETIVNPRPSTLESLKNGQALFNVNCAACHGPTGGGDGPIAAPNGPLAGVLPIGPGSPMGFSLAPGLTDGHIYTTISLGRGRMPNYRRISPDGRWDVVNYIRDLNGQGGR